MLVGAQRLALNQLPMRPAAGSRLRTRKTAGNPTRACWQRSTRATGLALVLAAALLSRTAGAEPQPSTIIVAFDASSDAQKQAVAAIQAHVSDLPVLVVVVSAERPRALDARLAASGTLAASRQALGTFSIEVAEDGSLLIFFTEADGEATLIRRLRPNQQGVRVALEQAAIVVRSLVEALLDGGTVGITPHSDGNVESKPSEIVGGEGAPSPGAAPATVDAPRTERPGVPEAPLKAGPNARRLALAAGSAVTQFAADVPWQAGFSVGIHWRATHELYAGARYTLFPALTIGSADAAVSVRRHPLEAFVGYREPGRVALNAEVGITADRAARTTVRTAAPFQATSPEARWVLAVGARGGFSWSPWSVVSGSMRMGADFVLTPYSYAIESAEALPSTRRVRPRVEIELAVGVW